MRASPAPLQGRARAHPPRPAPVATPRARSARRAFGPRRRTRARPRPTSRAAASASVAKERPSSELAGKTGYGKGIHACSHETCRRTSWCASLSTKWLPLFADRARCQNTLESCTVDVDAYEHETNRRDYRYTSPLAFRGGPGRPRRSLQLSIRGERARRGGYVAPRGGRL